MKTLLTAAAISAFLSTGCAGLQDIRQRPADMTTAVRGDYSSIAECFANRTDLVRHTPATLRFNRATKTANVYENVHGNVVSYDYTFKQQDDLVRVEARGMDTIFGTGHHPKAVWHLVAECANENQQK